VADQYCRHAGIFPGQPNQAYAFYSVARDHSGNREDIPALPDATTTAPIPLSIRRQDDDVIVEWTVPGRLQSSETLMGDFQDVPAAVSPYRMNTTSRLLTFWRLAE
jgi:hypothetical protein